MELDFEFNAVFGVIDVKKVVSKGPTCMPIWWAKWSL